MSEGTGVSNKSTKRVRPCSSGHLQEQVLTLKSWHLAISASNSELSEKIREKTRWITTSPGLQSRQLIPLVRMAIELQKQTRSDAKVFFNAVDNGIHKCIKIHLVWFVYKLVDGLWGELRGSALDRSTTCKSTKKIIMEHVNTANKIWKSTPWFHYLTCETELAKTKQINVLSAWAHWASYSIIVITCQISATQRMRIIESFVQKVGFSNFCKRSTNESDACCWTVSTAIQWRDSSDWSIIWHITM